MDFFTDEQVLILSLAFCGDIKVDRVGFSSILVLCTRTFGDDACWPSGVGLMSSKRELHWMGHSPVVWQNFSCGGWSGHWDVQSCLVLCVDIRMSYFVRIGFSWRLRGNKELKRC